MKLNLILVTSILVTIIGTAWAQEQMDKGAEAEYFTPIAAGVVRDKRTGLEWMRCSMGQDWVERTGTCNGKVERLSFEVAKTFAKKINAVGGYAGTTNWRLPTIDELKSLRYCSKGFTSNQCANGSAVPTIAQNVFPNMDSDKLDYWSSTPYASHNTIWVLVFGNGYVFSSVTNVGDAVRLVR